MADMHTPLRECPFCSGAADHDNGSKIVECSVCHGGFYEDTEADAIAHWNRRAPSQDAETVKALREALHEIEDLGSDGEHSGDRHAECRDIARAALAGSAS